MKKIAFLFPGQGSQKVGMGQALYDAFPAARDMFDMAESITGLSIKRLCFEGPMQELTETVNLQPAVTAVNLAFLKVLESRGVKPDVTAGHSLGEYSALCAAGVISADDTFRLVMRRGELMHREAGRRKGAMSAIVGLPIERVRQLVGEGAKTGTVSVANHNTETQIVITGEPEPVGTVAKLAKAEGARAIPLKVSGAWHSELIRGSVADFTEFLAGTDFSVPEIPVLMNVTADYGSEPDEIRKIMADQLCSPVRWYDAMQRLVAESVTHFFEIGPGAVLTGLLKKILPSDSSCSIHSVNSLENLDAFFNKVT